MYDEGDFALFNILQTSFLICSEIIYFFILKHPPLSQSKVLMHTETFFDGTIVIGSWPRMEESLDLCNLVSEKVIAYLLSLC